MKRKLKWTAVVLVVLLLGFGTTLFFFPRDRITVDSWKQIHLGMTEKEVERILGGPGTSYKDFLAAIDRLEAQMGKPPLIGKGIPVWEPDDGVEGVGNSKVWQGRRGIMEIQFNQECYVKWKLFSPMRPTDPTFLERLSDWLGW